MRHALRPAWLSRVWWCCVVVSVSLPWWAACPPAHAIDIEEYNFNNSDGGWTSGLGEWQYVVKSSNEKSWQLLLSGTNPSANYLYSPCLTVTNEVVRFDFQEHRFNFGTSGTVAPITYVPPAGQLQYTLDGINWQGVPLALWSSTGADVQPTLNPAFLVSPTTALLTSGYAFQGMSDGYDKPNPAFIKSGFDLTLALGSTLQFRLLGDLGGQTFTGSSNPIWDVDNVQIKGVVPGPCVPEPGTLALVTVGGGLVVLARLRRTPRGRAICGSTAVWAVVALAAIGAAMVATPPAKADVLFDFKIDKQGGVTSGTWTPSTTGFVLSSNQWMYNNTAKQWGVLATGADNPGKATGALLTSPVISGSVGDPAAPAVNARISIAHSFWLPPSGTGGPVPIAAGQVQYRLNGTGAWIGLPASAFTTGTSVNVPDPVFFDSPFYNPIDPAKPLYVDQTDYVFPTYVPPTGSYGSLPPLVNGGASFVGKSAGFPLKFVPSQAILNATTGLVGSISSLELRFVDANLNSSCPAGAGWNIRMVSVEFASTIEPVPEPATLALAACGGGAASVLRVLRRRSPPPLETE